VPAWQLGFSVCEREFELLHIQLHVPGAVSLKDNANPFQGVRTVRITLVGDSAIAADALLGSVSLLVESLAPGSLATVPVLQKQQEITLIDNAIACEVRIASCRGRSC
jgi:hypothetical protein